MQETPDFSMELLPMPRWVVEALDKMLKRWTQAGRNTRVEGIRDWEIVVALWQVWRKAYPEEYQDFVAKVRKTRSTHINKHGSSKFGPDGGQIRHIADIPGRFDKLLATFYPQQKYSKSFLHKLVKYIPDLQAPEKV